MGDGTTLILTEAKAESKQAFSSQSQDTRRFEHTETTVTGAETSADEAANLKTGANDITSEHGFEEQIPAPEFGDDGLPAGKPDRTLVPDRTMTQEEDSSPHVIETKIRIREDKIHEKFEKMSMSMSDPENTAEGEEFCQLSTSVLSKEDEEQAASNFDKILVDNFVEDKSEDWLTHESDPSPEKETGSGEIFGPPEKEKADGIQGTSDERG